MSVGWHRLAALAHVAQAGAMAGLVAQNDVKWPLNHLGWQKVLPERTSWYHIGWLVPLFPLLSSFNHAVSGWNPAYYDYVQETHTNPLRWTEFGLSSSVMVWLIAALSGVTDARALPSLVMMNGVMQGFGYLIERRYAEKAPGNEMKLLTILAWLAFMAIWWPIAMSFFEVTQWDSDAQPPNVVYAILVTMVVLFMSFGLWQAWYVSGRASFETYEKGFIGLSLTTKSILGWMVVGGVLMANHDWQKEKEG